MDRVKIVAEWNVGHLVSIKGCVRSFISPCTGKSLNVKFVSWAGRNSITITGISCTGAAFCEEVLVCRCKTFTHLSICLSFDIMMVLLGYGSEAAVSFSLRLCPSYGDSLSLGSWSIQIISLFTRLCGKHCVTLCGWGKSFDKGLGEEETWKPMLQTSLLVIVYQ